VFGQIKANRRIDRSKRRGLVAARSGYVSPGKTHEQSHTVDGERNRVA
jgi:hypothetical protein